MGCRRTAAKKPPFKTAFTFSGVGSSCFIDKCLTIFWGYWSIFGCFTGLFFCTGQFHKKGLKSRGVSPAVMLKTV
jgi:hypothetical protein